MLNHTNAFLQTVAGAMKESIEGFWESRVGSATLRVWGRLPQGHELRAGGRVALTRHRGEGKLRSRRAKGTELEVLE